MDKKFNVESGVPEFIVIKRVDKLVVGKVIGCDKDFGISIVNANNEDMFLVCHTMDVESKYRSPSEQVRIVYNLIKEKISKKYISISELTDEVEEIYGSTIARNPDSSNCPFRE